MASTFTSRIRLEKQGDGENPNSWGIVLNQNVIDLVDDAIAAYTTVSLSSADVTLTNNDGTSDQARSAFLELQGTLTANVNLVLPAQSKGYFIRNKTVLTASETTTIKTLAGTGATVGTSAIGWFVCDGVSVHRPDAVGLGLGTAADVDLSDISTQATADVNGAVTGSATITIVNVAGTIVVGQTVEGVGIPEDTTVSTINSVTEIVLSTAVTVADDAGLTFTNTISVSSVPPVSVTDFRYVRTSGDSTIAGAKTFTSTTTFNSLVTLASATTFKAPVIAPVTSLTDAASIAIDMGLSNNFAITLAGNRTLSAPTNVTPGQTGHIYVVQDGTGNRTLSFNNAYIFVSGTAPTMSTAANAIDLLVYDARTTTGIATLLLKAFATTS